MHLTRRHLSLVLVPLAALALGACGGDDGDAAAQSSSATSASASEPATVTVKTFDFQPDPLVVEAGTTITFVNEDAIDHTVTAGTRESPTPDVFDGQLPEKGATFDLVLDEPGTYDYFCEIHPGPGMTATITVE